MPQAKYKASEKASVIGVALFLNPEWGEKTSGHRTARAAGGILVAFASRFQPWMAKINHELSDTIVAIDLLYKPQSVLPIVVYI
ncbi:hypothetical protein TUM19329_17810 [Legionella antarctica]|uniref:Uncharacterized protein n=1 Tax=Legionella antarctica TaxID=2708020 RepID=A0A6F8T5J5_9GAMM|nr:hypothetical protein TUM19329_17810 [Legionella antarctica]